MNLNWINELIEELPETSTGRKNLIAIAGYPKWENVNSNLLAFYLDEKEEHGFSRLFLNSLLDIYETKIDGKSEFFKELLETDFVVDREVSTDSGKRIDLLIMQDNGSEKEDSTPDWAIIIENKLQAYLYNDLVDYWETIHSENKIGIVLTINPVKIDEKFIKRGIYYINITHRELVEKVKQNLSDYYIDADDRHLLFLKEYISNINSFYKDNKYIDKMDRTLELFHSKKNEIEELKNVDLKLLRYVSQSVFNVLGEAGFIPNSPKDSSSTKHFYIEEGSTSLSKEVKENIEVAGKFRLWVNLSQLRYCDLFEAYCELWHRENTKYGDELKNKLEELGIYTNQVQMGTGGRCGAGYQHIYSISIPIGNFSETGFEDQLKSSLKDNLFEHENKFIETAIIELKMIIEVTEASD